jgi:hypothetical protein
VIPAPTPHAGMPSDGEMAPGPRRPPRRPALPERALLAFLPALALVLATCSSAGSSPEAPGSSPSGPIPSVSASIEPSASLACPSTPPLLASGGGACPAPSEPAGSPTGPAGASPSGGAAPSDGVGTFHAELGGPRDGAGTYDGSGPIVCTAGARGTWTVSGAFETTDGIRAIELRQQEPTRVIGALTTYGSGPGSWVIAVPSDPKATAEIAVDETTDPVTVLATGRSVEGGSLYTMRIELTCGSVIR